MLRLNFTFIFSDDRDDHPHRDRDHDGVAEVVAKNDLMPRYELSSKRLDGLMLQCEHWNSYD